MTYDVHAHCIPAELVGWIRDHGHEAGIEVEPAGESITVGFAGRYRSLPLRNDLTDRARRLDTMDRTGVDIQVLSSWIDLTGYQLDPADGVRWARVVNDSLAGEAAHHPNRFLSIGTVPLQDPSAAADELRRIVDELGMVGVEIATRVGDMALDLAGLDEFWAAAAELKAFVLLHPIAPIPGVDLRRHFLHNMVGRPAETTIAFVGLLLDGLFERQPDLTMCVVHGGGFVPFQIGRLDQGYRAKPELVAKNLSMEPVAYLRRNVYVDSVVNEPAVLRFLVDLLGHERILVGSDYPFEAGDLDPIASVRAAGLSRDATDAILSGNAARLFGRPQTPR